MIDRSHAMSANDWLNAAIGRRVSGEEPTAPPPTTKPDIEVEPDVRPGSTPLPEPGQLPCPHPGTSCPTRE